MGRACIVLVLLLTATPLAAQRPLRDPDAKTTVRGVVVDALKGDPLPNAIVLLADENRGLLTDSLGRFAFEEVPLGPQLLAVKQYGYAEVNLDLDLRANHPPLTVELDPGPIALEGFTVIAQNLASTDRQLARRRKAYTGSVRAHDQARLASSSADNVIQFLRFQGGLQVYRCGRTPGACLLRRGGVTEPRIYIDEARVMGGLDYLAMFKPYELYLVEVFSGGAEIRAYTHWYMERMAERPTLLWPIGL